MTFIKTTLAPCTERHVRPRRTLVTALVWAFALAQPLSAQTGPQPRLKTATLTIGMHKVVAELAMTSEQQATGMMFRREMGVSEGMLFVNDDAGVRCFWMRNTLIPLSIAFIDEEGRIANIAEMQPQSDASHCSVRPVRYALEMNKGWYASRGIKAGAVVKGGPIGP